MKSSLMLAMSVLFALSALGCGGTSVPVTRIPVSADPEDEVNQLAQRVEQARAAKTDVLSPKWFERASKSLDKARETREKGGNVKDILEHVAEGQAELDRATAFAEVSATTLSKAIEARDAARAAGATQFGEEYDEVEGRFLAATREIEEDDLRSAREERDAITQAYQELELKAIKKSTLTAVRERIEEAVRVGAPTLAPKPLAMARKKMASTEKFIAKNRYAGKEMRKRANEALFHANRAVAIAKFATRTQKQTPEERALHQEAVLSSIARALGGVGDLRDQPIEQQQKVLVSKAAELRKDRDYLVQQTRRIRVEKLALTAELTTVQARMSEELAESAASEAKLRREKEFNERYEEARASFNADEAEVYKQGSRLLIRMRGIDFPSGDHVIQPQDYALLTKVQMAIRGFGEPYVTIEGHTDSQGSLVTNQLLSEERAQAVRSYFLANNVLPESRITAVGKAFSEPLAPNTTREGRALNRRIDVIIAPEQATGW